jgi:hypothetical protein
MFGLSRKRLVEAALISLFISFYHVYGQNLWTGYVESTGAPLGVGETALGYGVVTVSAIMFSWWISRGMKEKHDSK